MLALIQELVRHKVWASTALLDAIRENEDAARDAELHKLLHHTILANRFWLTLSLGLPFAQEEESRMPESLDAIEARYRDTHGQELDWIASITEADLNRELETPFIPGFSCSVAQAIMQVCMHTQGHHAQCVARLRQLGGVPPQTDFILWLKERPSPQLL